MVKEQNAEFDAGAYWQTRVVSGSDLGIVGHRSMGLAYNAQIYERRLEVLNGMLERHVVKPVEELKVLDVGCGSGFYTGYWAERGVREYVGVDISEATISHLSEQYPEFNFVNADITEGELDGLTDQRPFDVITIFDVFYHIVDDERFTRAVGNIGSILDDSGIVLIMDQLFPTRYQLSQHVVFRERGEYLELFDRAHLGLVDKELLFHFLVPPLSGYRAIDYLAAGAFKLAGLALRMSDRFAEWLAIRIRRLDRKLRLSGRQVYNNELLVFQKHEA